MKHCRKYPERLNSMKMALQKLVLSSDPDVVQRIERFANEAE